MTFLGLGLSTIGTDLTAGVQRFTFGRMDLIDGISFLLLAMGTFALSEALMMVLQRRKSEDTPVIPTSGLRISKSDVTAIVPTITRASILGFFVGVLPGAGATIASFLSYGFEKSLALNPAPEFGQGNICLLYTSPSPRD